MQILLADDHTLVRESLKMFIEQLESNANVIEASDFEGAMEQIGAPLDLVLLDLNMPGMNGFRGLDLMHEKIPQVPIIIITGEDIRRSLIEEALERGASGVIPKSISGKVMLNALQLVIAGERYVPSIILSQRQDDPTPSAYEAFAATLVHNRRSTDDCALGKLTPRERDVMALLVKGMSNKEIANHLNLREITIKVHLKHVFGKLGVSNRTQAVTTALKLGWEAQS